MDIGILPGTPPRQDASSCIHGRGREREARIVVVGRSMEDQFHDNMTVLWLPVSQPHASPWHQQIASLLSLVHNKSVIGEDSLTDIESNPLQLPPLPFRLGQLDVLPKVSPSTNISCHRPGRCYTLIPSNM